MTRMTLSTRIVLVASVVSCMIGAADAQADQFNGTWQASTTVNGMPVIFTMLMQNGSFSSQMRSAAGDMLITGTYRVLDANTIELQNKDYVPKEQCLPGPNYQVRCFPLRIPDRETNHFRFLNPNTVQIESTVPGLAPIQYQRVQ